MSRYKKVVVEGGDCVGKSTFIKKYSEKYPNVDFQDRDLINITPYTNLDSNIGESIIHIAESVINNPNTLYIFLISPNPAVLTDRVRIRRENNIVDEYDKYVVDYNEIYKTIARELALFDNVLTINSCIAASLYNVEIFLNRLLGGIEEMVVTIILKDTTILRNCKIYSGGRPITKEESLIKQLNNDKVVSIKNKVLSAGIQPNCIQHYWIHNENTCIDNLIDVYFKEE